MRAFGNKKRGVSILQMDNGEISISKDSIVNVDLLIEHSLKFHSNFFALQCINVLYYLLWLTRSSMLEPYIPILRSVTECGIRAMICSNHCLPVDTYYPGRLMIYIL